jgi:hypothetical protein
VRVPFEARFSRRTRVGFQAPVPPLGLGGERLPKTLREPKQEAEVLPSHVQREDPYTSGVVLLIGLMVIAIAVGLGGSAQASSTTSAARPTLTVTDMQPLSVNGRGFKARERVMVSTSGRRKSVTASSTGRFAVRFAGLSCAAGPIRAVGSKGSRAVTRPPKILCVEP